MKKQPANISLTALAQPLRWGLRLTLRKAWCELRRPGHRRTSPRPMPKGGWPYRLSFVVCTRGTCPVLPSALESLLHQTMPREDYEILVVWNRPDPPPKESLSQEIRWIPEPELGLSHARNTGARHALGEILLYMDDDAVADVHLGERICRAFSRHGKAAIVGGQIFLKLPSPRPRVVLPSREGLWSAYRVPYRHYRNVREQYAFPYGACFAVRHDALTAMGGFPVNYGRKGEDYAGGEETALCFRALHFGWKIGICPRGWVEHRVSPHRFTKEHAEKTIRAGILTTYRLYREGYAPYGWDLTYVKNQLDILQREKERLSHPMELFYKESEISAYRELLLQMEEESAKEAICQEV